MELIGITMPVLRLRSLATSNRVGLGREGGNEGYILSKADEVLMVGVDVGQLNVNQQQNLN